MARSEADVMKRDPGYAADIIAAAGKIKKYMHGKHRGQFDRNDMLRDAVIRQLGIIGEAASSLSQTFRDLHRAQPWRSIIGLRQILLHKYWNVDPNIVWETAKKHVQPLSTYLRNVLEPRSKRTAKKSAKQFDADIRESLLSPKRK